MKRNTAILAAVIIAASSAMPAFAADTFKDINDVPWGGAQAYINSVYKSGLMVGEIDKNGDRVFRANDNISYTETAQLVYALSGEKVSVEIADKWGYVMKKNNIPTWAYDCVAYCLENNILTSAELGVFYNADSTARYTTRETAAYMFGKLFVVKGIENNGTPKNFADKNNISAVCQQYVELLSSSDIFVGDEDNNFNPNKTINRAEMAVIVSKTKTFFEDKSVIENGEAVTKADYVGYINNVGPDFNNYGPRALMLYTMDGKSAVIDTMADSQYYLDGKEISTRGIYSLTSNGILVKAEIYVNSRNEAMQIYCTRADIEGEVTRLSEKTAKDKKGNEYTYNTITIIYSSGLSRSYIIDDSSDIYFDDDEIDVDEIAEILEEYPNVYCTADAQYNDEYDVYPNVYIKEIHMDYVLKDEGTLSYIDGEKIKLIADDGREYEYKFDDIIRYYLDGEKVRFTAFKNGVRTNLSKVELRFDNTGYISKIYAEKVN